MILMTCWYHTTLGLRETKSEVISVDDLRSLTQGPRPILHRLCNTWREGDTIYIEDRMPRGERLLPVENRTALTCNTEVEAVGLHMRLLQWMIEFPTPVDYFTLELEAMVSLGAPEVDALIRRLAVHLETDSQMIKIGFWQPNHNPEGEERDLPRAQECVDPLWGGQERTKVLQYLKTGKVKGRYRGFSRCRICDKSNGSTDLTDGKYLWPEGFAHYIEAHNVKPPQSFINYVMRKVRGEE